MKKKKGEGHIQWEHAEMQIWLLASKNPHCGTRNQGRWRERLLEEDETYNNRTNQAHDGENILSLSRAH